MLEGSDIIYVVRIPTKRIMTISLEVGSRLPAYATSMGQVLLANLPEEDLKKYFQITSLQSWTDKTVIDEAELTIRFAQIKKDGWVFVEQQLEQGLSSLAAPIRNHDGKVIAAINISSQANRIDNKMIENELLPLLLETADKISDDFSKSHRIARL